MSRRKVVILALVAAAALAFWFFAPLDHGSRLSSDLAFSHADVRGPLNSTDRAGSRAAVQDARITEPDATVSDGGFYQFEGRVLLKSDDNADFLVGSSVRVLAYDYINDPADRAESLQTVVRTDASTSTDGRGMFSIAAPRAAERYYRIEITNPRVTRMEFAGPGVVLDAAARREGDRSVVHFGDVVVAIAGSVQGKLLFNDGTPAGEGGAVALAEVFQHKREASAPAGFAWRAGFEVAVNKSTGSYLITGVRPGAYKLTGGLHNSPIRGASAPFIVIEQSTAEVDLYLPSPPVPADGSLNLKILGSGGPVDPFEVGIEFGSPPNTVRGRRADAAGNWHFDKIPAIACNLYIHDPAFADYEAAGIPLDGRTVTVTLEKLGSYTLAVRAQDAETGTQLHGVRARASFANCGGEISFNTDAPAALPARYTTLQFARDGYLTQYRNIPDPRPGERREETIQFERPCVVEGVAFASDGITPLPNISIQIGLPAGPFGATGADGRFRFEGLRAGDYQLSAYFPTGAIQTEIFRLAPGTPHKQALVAPPGAHLHARIESGDFDLRACRVDVVCGTDETRIYSSSVGSRGSLRFDELPEGPALLTLRFPENDIKNLPFGASPFGMEIGRVELATDVHGSDEEVVFDLRKRLPSELNIYITTDRRPVEYLLVSVWRDTADGFQAGSAVTNEAGEARILWIPPGVADLEMSPPSRAWVWRVRKAVELESGSRRSFSLDIPVARRTFILQFRDGTKLANTQMHTTWSGQGVSGESVAMTTDADGVVKITAPPGNIEFTISTAGGPRAVSAALFAVSDDPVAVVID